MPATSNPTTARMLKPPKDRSPNWMLLIVCRLIGIINRFSVDARDPATILGEADPPAADSAEALAGRSGRGKRIAPNLCGQRRAGRTEHQPAEYCGPGPGPSDDA